jgi:hypothetical protein
MTPELRVTRSPIELPGVGSGTLYSISAKRGAHLTVRASPASSAAFIDSYEFTPLTSVEQIHKLVLQAVACVTGQKNMLRVTISAHDHDFITALRVAGFKPTATVVGQRLEFTRTLV